MNRSWDSNRTEELAEVLFEEFVHRVDILTAQRVLTSTLRVIANIFHN
ncbi:hypothetical protein [Tunturiibacter gelidiferens]